MYIPKSLKRQAAWSDVSYRIACNQFSCDAILDFAVIYEVFVNDDLILFFGLSILAFYKHHTRFAWPKKTARDIKQTRKFAAGRREHTALSTNWNFAIWRHFHVTMRIDTLLITGRSRSVI